MRSLIVGGLLVSAVVLASHLWASDDSSGTSNKADAAVGIVQPEAGGKPPSEKDDAAQKEERLLELLDRLAESQRRSENPLVDVAGNMQEVETDLSQLVTGEPTQTKQAAIVKKLDVLIKQLDQACQACQNSGDGTGRTTSRPTRPLNDSRIVGGPGGKGKMQDPRDGGRDWAGLPPKERDRILQSLTEGFPSHYQQILERYYRRLAEEAPVSEVDGAARKNKTRSEPAKPAAEPPGTGERK